MAEGQIHDAQRLKELQALPLERKVQITQTRIIEAYLRYGGNAYVSFSGGKGSTVLLNITRKCYPDIPAVFVNTGLEYSEIQRFVKAFDDVTILRPKMMFTDVISTYGYPLISKEVGEAVYYARRIIPTEQNRTEQNRTEQNRTEQNRTTRRKRKELSGDRIDECFSESTNPKGGEKSGGLSLFNKKKWLPLARELPVMISHRCCSVMKKSPLRKYETATKALPILGTQASESRMRKQAWIRHGCNAFDASHPSSQPMSFWTDQDVLEYIVREGLDIAPVYGDIVNAGTEENPCLKCTGCTRTGCVFCAFGAHLEKESRFKHLAETHPRQYEYCIGGGQWVDNPKYDPTASMEPDEMGWVNWNPKKIWIPSKEGLGMGKVFDMMNELYGKTLYDYK